MGNMFPRTIPEYVLSGARYISPSRMISHLFQSLDARCAVSWILRLVIDILALFGCQSALLRQVGCSIPYSEVLRSSLIPYLTTLCKYFWGNGVRFTRECVKKSLKRRRDGPIRASRYRGLYSPAVVSGRSLLLRARHLPSNIPVTGWFGAFSGVRYKASSLPQLSISHFRRRSYFVLYKSPIIK